MELTDYLIRVGGGTLLGAVLGLEREVTGKAAGLRTHAMVGLGAALFTVLSMEAFGVGDPARVAAQIVSGIGFLGAGAIFRAGPLVKGLTTAAGLWAAAAIGMAAGAGQMAMAAMATVIAALVLTVLRQFDTILSRVRAGVVVEVEVSPATSFLDIRNDLVTLDPRVELVDMRTGTDSATLRFQVGRDQATVLCAALSAMPGVVSARVDDGSAGDHR